MKREEFNKLKFGDKVFKINHFGHTVNTYEVGAVKGRRVLIGDQFLDYVGDLTINEINQLWLDEKEACYAALEEIEDLKKPVNERLAEVGE
jgi:hypothetical protein